MCAVCFNQCTPAGPCEATPKSPLEVSLGRRGDEVWVRLRNVGCEPLYRLEGCCGEGRARIEQLLGGGGWGPAGCIKQTEGCCAALPSCVELASGAELDLRLHELEPCEGCSGTFRAQFRYFERATCPQTMDRPLLEGTSKALQVEQGSCE
jgi:hypothetical protein